SLIAYVPDGIVSGNCIAGASASRYPVGNFYPSAAAWSSLFVSYATDDYHLAPSSGLLKAGTDGNDVGADIDTINAQTASALSGDNTLPPGTPRVGIATASLPDAVLGQRYAQSLV